MRFHLFLAFLFMFSSCSQDKHLTGIWEGQTSVSGHQIEVILNFENKWNGSISCEVTFPQQFIVDLSSASCSVEADSVFFEITELLQANFKGKILGDSIVGTWLQNGKVVPLNFIKSPKQNYNRFVRSAIEFGRAFSVNTGLVNWAETKKKAIEMSSEAHSLDAIKPALRYLLAVMKDNHGAISVDGEWLGFSDDIVPVLTKEFRKSSYGQNKGIVVKSFSPGISYLRIPTSPSNEEELMKYSSNVQKEIEKILSAGIKGVILDLRLNEGGNMFSIVSGLRDLLGNRPIGEFYSPADQSVDSLRVCGDGFYVNNDKVFSFEERGLVRQHDIKVAVLVSPATASAAEGTVIALKSLKNLKVIGEPTKGFTTALKGLELGEMTFFISSKYQRDASGKLYTREIQPDQLVLGGDDFEDLQQDMKVKAALNWLAVEGNLSIH